MGKSLGSDVATGKVTYLSCAASDYDFAGWEDLTSSFKRKDMKSEIIPALRNFFEECGLKTKAEQMVEELLKLARVELESIQTVDKSNLAKFAELILQRRK
jgi:geranylgeranyl pyrophosphate synthase